MSRKILTMLLVVCAAAAASKCQSREERRMQAQVDVMEKLNQELEKKNRYDQTPEGKAKLQQKADEDSKKISEARCTAIWSRGSFETKLMGMTLAIESFECRGGVLYGTSIVPMAEEKNRKKVKAWTAAEIKKECPDNWKKFGNPCSK